MVVLDTSVIISALYSKRGQSNKLFFHCLKGDIEYSITPLLLWEYIGKVDEKIIDGTLAIKQKTADILLKRYLENASMIYQPILNRPVLPDAADDKILECAISSKSSCIVTFNIGHFPNSILSEYSIKAILPKTCLKKEKLK
jgi:putative PIN family toxin of toxin-antitoxin system